MAGYEDLFRMSDRYREFLEEAVKNILQGIRNDQLIKVMALEETSEAFIQQRVLEIIELIYKEDREKLIQSLMQELNALKAGGSSSSSSSSEELNRLRLELNNAQAKLKAAGSAGAGSSADLDRLQAQLSSQQAANASLTQ